MSTHELNWSAFLREPTSAERWLKRGDVLLRRREGETLRLSRESSGAAERDVLLAAVRLFRAAATQVKGQLDEAKVAAEMPWTRFLPADDQRAFVHEFISTLEACADLEDFSAVGRLLADWKSTASLHADGSARRLSNPVGAIGKRVSRP